jgi:DNA-binding NtrC family response regulator
MSSRNRSAEEGGSAGKHVVLIISSDAVAAALLGALVETLGYLIRFYRAPDSIDETLRRTRPSVAMVDCTDPTLVREDLLGRARMRGISVVIFGTPDALRRVRQVAQEHQLDTLIMPTSLDELDETLRKICDVET